MNILKYELMPEVELLARLKKVKLKGHGEPEVYQDADLRILEQYDPIYLAPAQRYVLKGGIQDILDIADSFEDQHRIDVFRLPGALMFWKDEMNPEVDAPIPFLPPIVEESFEPNGREKRRVLIINDGIHRIYAAWKRGRHINIVLATGVPSIYPYYAFALPNGWKDVEEIPELTEDYKKKEYREKDYKALFRDFNAQFEGVQKPRLQTKHEKA